MSLFYDPSPALVDKMLRVNFVIMDVDGTIVSADDQDALNVSQMLGRLDKANIRWSFATGRSIGGLYSALPRILGIRRTRSFLPSLCYNGAVVFVPGDPAVLSITTMRVPDVHRIVEIGLSRNIPLSVYTCRSQLGSPVEAVHTNRDVELFKYDVNGMPYTRVNDWRQFDATDTVAVLFEVDNSNTSKSDLASLHESLGPSVRVTSSGGPYYEFSHSSVSKGTALVRMFDAVHDLGKRFDSWRKFEKLELDTTMAIGDNLNDQDMLTRALVGVAVANSRDELKQAADIITSLPSGAGVVETLRLLLDVKKYRLDALF